MANTVQNKLFALTETFSLARQRLSALGQMRARLGYIGGQGDANLGDEAMFEAAKRLMPTKQLLPIGFPRQERRLAHSGLSGKSYFESAVLGGGTLINDYIWKERVRTMLAENVPIWSLGTGVGSCGFGHSESMDLVDWKPMLADFAGIGVRGPLSQATLQSMGIANVEIVGDLALSLARDQAEEPSESPCFALNTTSPPAHSRDEGDYSALAELEPLLCELRQRGWLPIPIAMHRADVEPLQRLLDKTGVGNQKVDVITDAETFFHRVAPCHFTVAVRLHAAVLSCCVGVPPLMLGYRDKCLDFMQSMQLGNWHLHLESAKRGDVFEKAVALSNHDPILRSTIILQSCAWRQRIARYTQDITKIMEQ